MRLPLLIVVALILSILGISLFIIHDHLDQLITFNKKAVNLNTTLVCTKGKQVAGLRNTLWHCTERGKPFDVPL